MKKLGFVYVSLISFLASFGQVFAQSTCSLNGKTVPCDQMMEGVGIFFFVFMGLFFVFMIALTVFWVMMLIHAIKNQTDNKVMWILILIFTSGLGAIIYYFAEKRPMDKAKKLENQNNVGV